MSWFMVHPSGPVTIVFINGRGDSQCWTGQLLRLGPTGPIVDWNGEPRRLCPWEAIRAAEDARRKVPR